MISVSGGIGNSIEKAHMLVNKKHIHIALMGIPIDRSRINLGSSSIKDPDLTAKENREKSENRAKCYEQNK